LLNRQCGRTLGSAWICFTRFIGAIGGRCIGTIGMVHPGTLFHRRQRGIPMHSYDNRSEIRALIPRPEPEPRRTSCRRPPCAAARGTPPPARPPPPSAAVPGVRSHCRFRNRGAEYVSESGITWMSGAEYVIESGVKWMRGGAKRQCGRALCGASRSSRPTAAETARSSLVQGDTVILHCHWLPLTAIP
jgi:hypothetical protein